MQLWKVNSVNVSIIFALFTRASLTNVGGLVLRWFQYCQQTHEMTHLLKKYILFKLMFTLSFTKMTTLSLLKYSGLFWNFLILCARIHTTCFHFIPVLKRSSWTELNKKKFWKIAQKPVACLGVSRLQLCSTIWILAPMCGLMQSQNAKKKL